MSARADETRRRSAASRKGWEARRRRAALLAGEPLMTCAEIDALRGTQTDRVLTPEASRETIRRALDRLKLREAEG